MALGLATDDAIRPHRLPVDPAAAFAGHIERRSAKVQVRSSSALLTARYASWMRRGGRTSRSILVGVRMPGGTGRASRDIVGACLNQRECRISLPARGRPDGAADHTGEET